jgi:hypothetical protein
MMGIKEGQNKKGNQTMNNIKRTSLMTAIFLTVALVSSAVEAGVIRINGTIAGSEIDTPFPDPAEGFMSMGASRQPTRSLVRSRCFIRLHWTSLSWVRHLGTSRGFV